MARHTVPGFHRGIVTLGTTLALCGGGLFLATPAHAVTVNELQAKVDEAARAHDEAASKVSELEAQAAQAQAKVDEVEGQLPAQRERAEKSMSAMYKMQQSSPGLVSLLLSSDTFTDFLTTYQRLSVVQKDNLSEVSRLAQLEDQLNSSKQELDAATSEATAERDQAADALSEAQSALDELNRQIAAQAAAEQAAREKAAAEASAQAAAQQAAQSQAASQDSAGQPAPTPGTSAGAAPSQPSNPGATDGSEVKTDGEWMIGSASAYSVADNTGGNGTASGEELTDNSMTVAVPASQSYLLGRSVQIRWGGKTVTARVTDTGGFAAYGRVLDLAGGVWKAFGFSSANDWGVRTVQYRFL